MRKIVAHKLTSLSSSLRNFNLEKNLEKTRTKFPHSPGNRATDELKKKNLVIGFYSLPFHREFLILIKFISKVRKQVRVVKKILEKSDKFSFPDEYSINHYLNVLFSTKTNQYLSIEKSNDKF